MKKTIKILGALFFLCVLALGLCACNENSSPEATFTVQYSAGREGRIDGNANQTVSAGEDAETVTAVPYTGRVFIKWSDGVTEATRTDKNVTSDITVTAIFEKIIYSVKYTAGAHGFIEGELDQSVECLENGSRVTAIPDKGYVFAGWSDGVETATRYESVVTSNKELTAYFESLTRTYLYEYKFADSDCDPKRLL